MIKRYGKNWDDRYDDLQIEMAMIRLGGGKEGLSFHYEKMRNIIWPELDAHRWHNLCRDEILKNKVTVLMGCGSSGKTHEASWIRLCEYLCFPDETCVLVSSTDIRGLKLRVWGEICSLWQRAVERFDYLPGHYLDSKIAITTQQLEDDGDFDNRSVRDLRLGIIGVPCIQGGRFVGLQKFMGIKQKRLRLIADEAQFMGPSFLSAFSNLDKGGDFQAIVLGNPADIMDPLGRAAEPIDGWGGHMEPTKTTVWKTKLFNGVCVNLIGTDSPNFDYPPDQPARYKYLISREKIANTLTFFSKDSIEYYMQCVGVMKVGTMSRRVITRDLCTLNNASDPDVVWNGRKQTIKVAALDSAYGGDRCVFIRGEFGEDVDGKTILLFQRPEIVPVLVSKQREPEYQIADYVKAACEANGIPPENFGHDSTGRGSLGTALAQVWSPMTNPVEFGGSPTERPVCLDLFITDERGVRRLKTCKEHYSKFVTELWFSVRYAIEAGQVRGLAEDVIDEGCRREWKQTKNDKKELEKKQDMKERTGQSPDLFDAASILVEMARRKGFEIAKLASEDAVSNNYDWLNRMASQRRAMIQRASLDYAV